MTALIGALRVSLSAETAQFEAGMKRAQRTANQTRSSFQKSFGGLGGVVKAGLAGVVSGLSIGLLTQGVRAALDYAGSLGEVAQQLGVTTRELQVFRYAVQQNGGTVEQADQALGKFSVSISKALSGSKQAAAAFNAVGVSLADLQSKSRTELLGQIADGMKAAGGASKNAAAGVAIFGRGFTSIVPTLDLGSKGFSEVAAAAEKLGIIMDDSVIEQADEAADKLDALQTLLKTQVSVAIAESSDEIIELGNSFSSLIGFIGDAIGYLRAFRGALNALQAQRTLINPFASKEDKANARAALFRARLDEQEGMGKFKLGSMGSGGKARSGGGSPSQFLAGGGGGGRSKADDAERKRLEALREAFQFDQELLRAQMDTVRARQDLAIEEEQRSALSIQLLNLEKQGFEREMEYAVAAGELSKAQAAQLEAEFAKKDALERQAVLQEEQARRSENYNHLEQLDFDLQRDILQSQEQLADTAKEQRAIRLRLLDLDYRAERARLEAVIADEQASYAAKEEARRRLLALNKTEANDRQGVINSTRSPFEQFRADFGDITEEMEDLQVRGIMGAVDALASLTEGFDSFRQNAISAIKAVIAEFIRLQLMKMAANLFGSAMGAPAGAGSISVTGLPGTLPGFATGGGFNVLGRKGVDNNLLSLNGLPIARVSHGERVNISNDNTRMGGNPVNISFAISGPVTRETQMQIAAATRRGIASANRKGM